ncbi:hypothetical protein MC28_E128 (plasmid) [Bacillus thuringiensis MC28]|nr:hypothetical protein MC28_E128 [Bacillus thuringiensis MC28]
MLFQWMIFRMEQTLKNQHIRFIIGYGEVNKFAITPLLQVKSMFCLLMSIDRINIKNIQYR